MPKAQILLISAPKWHNKMMIAADLFDEGKVLGHQSWLEVQYKEDAEVTLGRAYLAVNELAAADQDKLIVSLVHLISVEARDSVTFNKTIPPHWNRGVRMISTGREWYMLDDFVRSLGFQVKTDEHRYIKEIY